MELSLQDLAGLRVHLLGAGGIGVSALARLLKACGVAVSGCDVRESSLVAALRREGIPVAIGHDPGHVSEADVVVYSTAVPRGNEEHEAAVASGKVVLHRSEVLSLLADARECVGVTGTNGKGTVSAMITWILERAGLEPSWYIGALCPNLGTNARWGGGRQMVAELDESDGSVVNIRPRYALLNNLELDHLNYYRSLDHAVETLVKFFGGLAPEALCFFNADDEGCRRVADAVEGRCRVFFGTSEGADYRWRAVEVGDRRSVFEVDCREGDQTRFLGRFELGVPGSYNIENAAGAVAVATELGVDARAIGEALATFGGLQNRYTVVEAGGRKLIKDYMSHPTGIRKVLATARLSEPARVVAVFKPYRYTMIRYHAPNYAEAFAGADEVVVTEMWEAGEEPIPGVSTPWLCEEMRRAGRKVTYIEEMEPIVGHLRAHSRPGDCIVFFGGDDLFALADELAAHFSGA